MPFVHMDYEELELAVTALREHALHRQSTDAETLALKFLHAQSEVAPRPVEEWQPEEETVAPAPPGEAGA